MSIETERLILRRPEMADAPAMLEIRNSPYVLRYNPMKPWELPRMEKQVEEEIKAQRTFYIEEKGTSALLGGVWLEPDDLRHGLTSFTLSYYLAESAAGKGYMTEALSALIPYIFQELGAQVLAARVFSENRPSARLLQKLGFTHEGTLRQAVATPRGEIFDDMIFSLLREEAQPQECLNHRVYKQNPINL